MFLLVGCFCLALSKTALFLSWEEQSPLSLSCTLNTLQKSVLETHSKTKRTRRWRGNRKTSVFAVTVFAQTFWHVKSERECMGGQNRGTTGTSQSICFAAVHLLVFQSVCLRGDSVTSILYCSLLSSPQRQFLWPGVLTNKKWQMLHSDGISLILGRLGKCHYYQSFSEILTACELPQPLTFVKSLLL